MPKNVVDWFQSYEDSFIKESLDSTRLPLRVACENVNGDFHKGNILRTAEGFNVDSVWIVGNRRVDMRATVGAHHRLNLNKVDTLDDIPIRKPVDSVRVVLDNVPGAVPMHKYNWHPNTLLIVGEEQRGVSQEALDFADEVVYIPMLGAVRSFSVSTAAGIAMYDYVNKTTGFVNDRDNNVLHT